MMTSRAIHTALVETYRLVTANGRYIRRATKVTLNGEVVKFVDFIPSKRDAIKQATNVLASKVR